MADRAAWSTVVLVGGLLALLTIAGLSVLGPVLNKPVTPVTLKNDLWRAEPAPRAAR
jgi:hypothetical protein